MFSSGLYFSHQEVPHTLGKAYQRNHGVTKAFLQNVKEGLVNSSGTKLSTLFMNSVSNFIHTFSAFVHALVLLFDRYVLM